MRTFGNGVADIMRTIMASMRGQFDSLAARPMSRREELVRRLARQRDRVQQAAARGPRVADVKAQRTIRVNARAAERAADAARQQRVVENILNRRRQMIRTDRFSDTLFEADRFGSRTRPRADLPGGRFDLDAGRLYGADRFGTYGPQPPDAMTRIAQRIQEPFKKLSDAIMLQTVRLSNVLAAAAAKISAGFVNLGGAFAGIGFILKNLKGLIEFSRSNFKFDFARMGRSLFMNDAIRRTKNMLPAGTPQLRLPAPKTRIPVTPKVKTPLQLPAVASGGGGETLDVRDKRFASVAEKIRKRRLIVEERLAKAAARSTVVKKASNAAEKVETKVKKVNTAVNEAANKSIDKSIFKKLREAAARKLSARAIRAEEKAQAALNRENAKSTMPSLRELKRSIRSKNVELAGDTRSGRKRLDSMLDDFYGGGNRAFTRGRRKLVLRGLDSEFGGLLEKSREIGKAGGKPVMMPFRGKDVKVTADLAKAFDAASVSAARFSGIIGGMTKFLGVGLILLRALAPLLKMVANIGAEAKGLEEYKNSIREITNEFQELATNTLKLAEARKLLAKEQDIFSPDGPTTIAETLEEYVKEQEKALAAQSKNISEGLGKAFLDGMLLVENDIDEGALAKRFMGIFEKVTGDTEQQIKERMAIPIGEAIRGIFEEGTIPSFQDIFDQLLFAEDEDGTYLSRFFTGTSREIIDAIISEGNPFEVLGDLYGEATKDLDFLNMDSFALASADIGMGLFDILDKYTSFTGVKGDELAQRIAQGNLFQGIGESTIAAIGGADILEHELNEIFGTLADAFNTAMPDATDTEVGNAIMEFLMFIETFNNLAGKSIDEIGDTLSKLPEDSDAMGALRDMLQIYLDEMVTAGYLSERELLNAGNSTEKLLKLYANTQTAISDEITTANKKMQDEFGITAEMSLRLAIKAKEAFKQIREAATALGKPLEDAELTDQSFGKLLFNLEQNRRAIEKYEKDIAQLRAQGFEFTADRLLAMGLGGRDIAARALADPMAAQALELELIKTAPLTAADAGVVSPLMDDKFMDQMQNMGIQITESFVKGIEDGFPIIRQMFGDLGEEVVASLREALGFGSPSKVMMQFGEWTSMGFAEGIQKATPQTEVAMKNMAKDSAAAFRAILGINSNSTLFKQYGQNVGNGFIEGLENTIGQSSGVNSTFEDFAQMIATVGLSIEAFAAYVTGDTGGGNFQLFLEKFMAGVNSKAQEYVSEQQKAFAVVTQLTSAERARNAALLNVMQSKASLAKQLRDEASLQDRIGDTLERLNRLEQEGKAGNVTVKERIGILQQLLSLREMEKRAAGEFTAKEQLAINEKEQEVNTMARMYNQGVISALEFQAAQEELSEMRGEFKTEEDKELFFLQLADTEREYKDAQANALKIDQELVSTREEYFGLLDEQEQMTLRVQVAQDRYSAATEGAVEADMALTQAILYFEENIGPHMETLTEIANRYGDITDEVNELIEAVEAYQEGTIDGIFGPGGAEVPETAIYEAAKDKAVEETLNETVVAANQVMAGERMTMQEAKTVFGDSLKEADLYDDFNRFLNNPLVSPIFKQGTSLNMASNRLDENQQFMTSSDLGQIQRIMTTLNDMGISERLNTENTGQVILKQFIESLGLNLYRKSDGSGYAFLDKNLEMVEDQIGIELGTFLDNFGDLFSGISKLDATMMGPNSAANQAYIDEVLSGSPVHVEMDAGVEVGPDPTGTPQTYTSYPLLMENANGQRRTVTNDAAKARAEADGYTSTGRRGYAMGGRIKGYKMGGRIPDMSHIKPNTYAMGGRAADHMMKRALVGEYGPEEVRFVPGSGFLVKPLTTGGRGNNTIVQNLSVNVTGVPVDNASARKAAIQIKKALQRLDREGNAGGGVRNV